VDVTAIDATLSFDARVRVARAEATMRFTVDDPAASCVFDLRQDIAGAWLDHEPLPAERLARTADGVRVIDTGGSLAAGDHELQLVYDLDVPDVADPLPVGWTSNVPGVVFDLWMSDLHPGRYLESWLPAPLCHDRFQLRIELDLSGSSEAHAVFANGAYRHDGVVYPDTCTSLSPMLVVAPEARVEVIDSGGITVCKLAGPEIDLDSCHSQIRSYLDHNRETFGDYVFGDTFLAYVWGSARGMEYDGATTSSVGALEHEVFHSWFGRGVKPACANDGWIDEAFTTWYTAGQPRQRQWAEPFDWDEPPVLLRPPGAYDRFTPREAYTVGARLFAGVADVLGGPEGLVEAMAGLYREKAGGFLTTDELEATLSAAVGSSHAGQVRAAFDRWVHADRRSPANSEGGASSR
jgi:hypothetical protein